MNDLTNGEQQRQQPEEVQQQETDPGAAQDGQQPLKEEPPEREALATDREEDYLRQWEAMTPEEQAALSETVEAAKKQIADMVNPLREAETQRQQALNEIANTINISKQLSKQLTDSITDSIREALPDISALSASIVESTTAAMRQIAESGLKIAAFYESESYKAFKESVSGFDNYVEEREKQFEAGDFTFLGAFVDNVDELLPYIKEEIEAYKKETGKEEVTFDEFMFHAVDPETGEEAASILERVLEKAQERADQDAAAAEAARSVEEATKNLPHFYIHQKSNTTLFPLDKFNLKVWHNIPANELVPIKMESNIKAINRDGKQLTGRFLASRELTEDHFSVFIEISNLCAQGTYQMTATQIFRATNKGEPGAAQLEKINRLVSEMLGTTIFMDNTEWAAAKGKEKAYNRTFQLLKGEVIDERAVFNGRIAESYITIDEMPILFKYADDANQITRFPNEVFHAPINQTLTTGIYEHYLLDKIGHAKRRAGKNKSGKATASFKWRTIFDYAGENDKRAKARAKQYVKRYLDHYKTCGEIESYSISGNTETSTVTIICRSKQKD